MRIREVVCGTREEENCLIVLRKALALKAGRRSEHDRLEREVCQNCKKIKRTPPLRGIREIGGRRVYYI